MEVLAQAGARLDFAWGGSTNAALRHGVKRPADGSGGNPPVGRRHRPRQGFGESGGRSGINAAHNFPRRMCARADTGVGMERGHFIAGIAWVGPFLTGGGTTS